MSLGDKYSSGLLTKQDPRKTQTAYETIKKLGYTLGLGANLKKGASPNTLSQFQIISMLYQTNSFL